MTAVARVSEWRNCADRTAGRRATTYGEGKKMMGVTIKTLLRHQHLAQLRGFGSDFENFGALSA